MWWILAKFQSISIKMSSVTVKGSIIKRSTASWVFCIDICSTCNQQFCYVHLIYINQNWKKQSINNNHFTIQSKNSWKLPLLAARCKGLFSVKWFAELTSTPLSNNSFTTLSIPNLNKCISKLKLYSKLLKSNENRVCLFTQGCKRIVHCWTKCIRIFSSLLNTFRSFSVLKWFAFSVSVAIKHKKKIGCRSHR